MTDSGVMDTADWISILSSLASVSVALIGFSGLLIAFRSANAPLSRADMVYIRILLIFSLGALVFALLPLPFADVAPDRLWPAMTLLLAAFLLFWPLRTPFWNRARGIKPRRPYFYWGVLGAEAILALYLMWTVADGSADGGSYALGVAWCLLVTIVSFVSQVFSQLPVDEG